MSGQLVYPIELNYNIDWDRIRKIYSKLVEKTNQGVFQKHSEPNYDADRYDIGSYGSIISSISLTSGIDWNVWGGKLLETVLPLELLALKQEIIGGGLNFVNFNYFQHTGNVDLHCDGKRKGEAPGGHCNINYIVTCNNVSTETIVYSDTVDGYKESYNGSGKWWLIDTAKPHEVKNSGFREVFQIKIFDPFEKVKDFFETRTERSL